jgi:hypothetical protein
MPTSPPPGPATCTAAANLALAAAQLLTKAEVLTPGNLITGEITTDRPTDEARAEAAGLLRAAANLVAPPVPPGPVTR